MLNKLLQIFFKKKVTIFEWELDLAVFGILLIGIIAGVYITLAGLIPTITAAGDTGHIWNFGNAGDYTLSNQDQIEIADGTARLRLRSYLPDEQTVALYHLNESVGTTVTDDSSYTNDGVLAAGTWQSIGGTFDGALQLNGITDYIRVPDSTSLSFTGQHTLEAWTKLDTTLTATNYSQRQGIIDKGDYQLYYDNETGKVVYEVVPDTAATWTQRGGVSMDTDWSINGKYSVSALASQGNYIFAGTGAALAGDAEVWMLDTTSGIWTKIAGASLNNSWVANTYEEVNSMAVIGTMVYVGLGNTTGDGEVWQLDVSQTPFSWSKIGGDINNSWTPAIERVLSMTTDDTNLYVGLGVTATTDPHVWKWDGSAWEKLGGNGARSGWNAGPEGVYSLAHDGTYLYAGLGITATLDSQVWRLDTVTTEPLPTWELIGGNVNNSWTTDFEVISRLVAYDGKVYAGLGQNNSDAEIWEWNGASWTRIGGSADFGAGYEKVVSMVADNDILYVGLGINGTDARLWQYTIAAETPAWTQIGGNTADNPGWTTHTEIRSIMVHNGDIYAGLWGSNAAGYLWRLSEGTWTLIGGNYINGSWGFGRSLHTVEKITTANGKLYAGMGTSVAGNALVWEYDGTTWTLVGGQGMRGSWTPNTYELVNAMTSFQGDLYVGLGSTQGDGDVWKYDGTTWTRIATGTTPGWSATIERVLSMAADDDYLYVGLGVTQHVDSQVWRWDGDSWEQIGGRLVGGAGQLNNGWSQNIEGVYSLLTTKDAVYAGLGHSSGDAAVWRWDKNASSWTRIGGTNLNNWANSTFETVETLIMFDGELYAGLGNQAGDAQVWRWNGTDAWTYIDGGDAASRWPDATYTRVRSMAVYNGELYASLGGTTGLGEVWRYNKVDNAWIKVAGNSLNDSWGATIEDVYGLTVYQGKLFVGTGNTANADAAVWSYGNNLYLESATSGFDDSWRHIAATYDGATMRLYIDGELDASHEASVSIRDSNIALLIGSSYGSHTSGANQGLLAGMLDELRLSNTARTSFVIKPYATIAQTVNPAAAQLTQGIQQWDEFLPTETLAGGTITYRLSADSGENWLYWNDAVWQSSTDLAQTNLAAVIHDNIDSFPVGAGGIMWQAVLQGNGNQQVTLSEVEITATSDTQAPLPPTALSAALSENGGTPIETQHWHAYPNPYFSWPADEAPGGATDNGGSGVAGYYVYFGSDETAIPETASAGVQTDTFFSASGLINGTTYFLRIQTVDHAQNVSAVWDAFEYRYDSAPPTNPGALSASPAGYSGVNEFTFFWSSTAVDGGSGIAGYQYKTGAESGPYSDWSEMITQTSITLTEPAYQEGENIFYLRTIDNAGNVSTATMQVNFYFAGTAPTAPQNLTVDSPNPNTENSFAFSWSPPESFTGNVIDLRYCYTINTLPTVNTCTFTAKNQTAIGPDAFANQPGENTLYVATIDDVGNINYDAYASITFIADTQAPGMPLNVEIADVSVKTIESWKLALSWEPPTDETNTVDKYEVWVSTDDATYANVASTTDIAYIGTGLQQVVYYYKIRACDSTNNCGAFTQPVSMLPDGRYTEPAALVQGPTVFNISTRKAVVAWTTDRTSDTRVAFGTTSGSYFIEEPSNSNHVTNHILALNNLDPGTRYFYVAKWTDEDGNIGISDESTFETTPAPTIQSVSVPAVTLSSAFVQYTSINAAKVRIYYGVGSLLTNVLEEETSLAESVYISLLDALEDGTTYNFKINPVDADGFEYEGTVFEFTTVPRPRISNVTIEEVLGTAQPTVTVTWETNVETSSIVTYHPVGVPDQARNEVNVNHVQGQHVMTLSGLNTQTAYTIIARGIDRYGNEATSDPHTITTAIDTRPPIISNFKVDTSIETRPGSTERVAQVVVSWDTDEPATSQVEFGEGTGSVYTQRTQEDTNLKTNHLVILPNMSPSRVYHLRAVSRDDAGNVGVSADLVTITPKATDSAFNLVIQNLQEIFGFLRGFRL